MTHRPIEPIAIPGVTPGGTPRAYPIFEDVDPRTLLVDEGYQRDSSERSMKLVRKIVAGWDWAKFKAPCAVMTDAGLELIDGQHTAIAAATHPEIKTIPVMIVDVAKRAERAAAFIGHNKDRVAVTTAQIHVAALMAGDAEAFTIESVCSAAGVKTLTAKPKDHRPGETMAISAVGAVIRGREKVGAIRVLKVAVDAKIAPLTQIEIKAIDLLLYGSDYQGQISDAALVATITTMGRKAYSEANVFRAAHPTTPLWKALAITWFKNRRGTKSYQNSDNSPSTGSASPSNHRNAAPAPSNRDEKINTAVSGQEKAANIQLGNPAAIEKRRGLPMSGYMVPTGKTKAKIDLADNEDRPRVLLPPDRAGQSVADGAKHDDRGSLRGWRPGNHLRRCGQCGTPYVGHLRSVECADCAYRAEAVERAS
jgi:hypothetical protein